MATTQQAFNRRVAEVRFPKTDINNVVMDYLINAGYPEAAQKFAQEANIAMMTGDTDTIHERVLIRNDILAGNIPSAIEKINDLNPELLDTNPTLHFSLLRLHLVELIRRRPDPSSTTSDDITPALQFASSHLAPLAPTHPSFLSDLEHTMALLIYPHNDLSPALQRLLDPKLRQDVATAVNEAVLESQGHRARSRLKSLLRARAWSERRAREQKIDLPRALDLWGKDGVSDPKANNGTGEAGNGVASNGSASNGAAGVRDESSTPSTAQRTRQPHVEDSAMTGEGEASADRDSAARYS